MKPQILILNGTCLDVLQDHREWLDEQRIEVVANPRFLNASEAEFASLLRNLDAVVGPTPRTLTPSIMEESPRLLAISLASSGFESINLTAATENGIVVTNVTVPAGAEVVADHTWGLILSVTRQIPHHHQAIVEGRSVRGMGVAAYGKTLGIVGLGNIGKAVVRRATGFDMRILATGLAPDQAFVAHHRIELVDLDELLRKSDIVSLHLRLDTQTKEIIGARELALMKPTAFLINTARSELVDEVALTHAVVKQKIAGAALDDPPMSPESPLLARANVIFTPHLGNRAMEAVQAVTRCALQNVVDVLHGKRPAYVVNPEVYKSAKLRGRQLQS